MVRRRASSATRRRCGAELAALRRAHRRRRADGHDDGPRPRRPAALLPAAGRAGRASSRRDLGAVRGHTDRGARRRHPLQDGRPAAAGARRATCSRASRRRACVGDAPKLGRADRAGRGARQAPAHPLRGRPGAAHPPAHDRLVARLPRAGAVAEAGLPGPGGGRRRQRLGGGVLPGAGRGDLPPRGRRARRRWPGSVPTCAGRSPSADAVLDDDASSAPAGSRAPAPTLGRGAARPADRGRHRQRLQVGGVLRGRRRPGHAGRSASTSRRAAGCGRSRPASSRPTSARRSAAPTPPASPSTAAAASRATAAARRSAWPATATRPGAPTGARPASRRRPATS